MTNEELKLKFDQALKPLQYKKKGNKWFTSTEDLTKLIELQKSGYSNLYYVNYGVNFNKLDYEGVKFHIFNRHKNTLDLETASDDILLQLTEESIDQVTQTLNRLSTIQDVLKYTETLPTLNILPLKVKEFLKLK